MKKRDKIIYWVATIWLSLGMTSTAIVQLLKTDEEVARMTQMGYPSYLLTLIGVAKLLGVIAILVPGVLRLKEWAYAGFLFLMLGADFSHLVNGDPGEEIFGPTLLLVLTMVSWWYRPADRKFERVRKNHESKS